MKNLDTIGLIVKKTPNNKRIAQILLEKKKLMIQRIMFCSLSNEISNKAWVIDSGSSKHITGYKETLDFLSEKVNGEVTIGDNSAHSIKGIGSYTLKLKTGNTLLLKCNVSVLEVVDLINLIN